MQTGSGSRLRRPQLPYAASGRGAYVKRTVSIR